MSVVGSLSFALSRDLQPSEERYLTSPITVSIAETPSAQPVRSTQ